MSMMTAEATGSNTLVDTGALSKLKSLQTTTVNQTSSRDAQLREVSRQFAGLFLGEVFKSMRGEQQDMNEIGFGGSGEKIFQEMADEAIASEICNSQSYGLSDLVYQSMVRRSSVIPASSAASTASTTDTTSAATAATAATTNTENKNSTVTAAEQKAATEITLPLEG